MGEGVEGWGGGRDGRRGYEGRGEGGMRDGGRG